MCLACLLGCADQTGSDTAGPPAGTPRTVRAAPTLDALVAQAEELGPWVVIEPPGSANASILPGIASVSHVHASDDGWLVMDGPAARLVLVDASGRVTATRGRPGDGPGELSAPARAARAGNEVAVLDMAATRLDRYAVSGDPLPRVHLPTSTCAGTLAEELDRHGDDWIVVQRCSDRARTRVRVLKVGPDGQVDSLGVASAVGQLTDPFLRSVVLSVPKSGLHLGSTRALCLRLIAGSGPPEFCLRPVPRRPVPDAFRAQFERRVAGRARAVGMAFQVPEHLPPLLSARGIDERTVAVRRPLDDRHAPWVLERIGGGTLTLLAEWGTRIEPGPQGLLVLRHELDGVRARVVPLPTWQP